MEGLIFKFIIACLAIGTALGVAQRIGFLEKEGDEPDVSESGTRARRAFWGHTFKGLIVLILGFILFSYLEFQRGI
jgi:hypothetical protein